MFSSFRPTAVFHFAAESHVDRSIEGPSVFLRTNVYGTFVLLEAALRYLTALNSSGERHRFRFVHVSTDEVFGSLSPEAHPFSESTAYAPSSPYAASKAASDHFVRAWYHTYGLPTLTTNCTNNFGPYQAPEKFIPTIVLSAIEGREIPVYGDGSNIRDWLYVEDHCSALKRIWESGRPGETYTIGAQNERTNLELVERIAGILDRKRLRSDGRSYRDQVRFVVDRPGHDRRYAMDARKIRTELGWKPSHPFWEALDHTVSWYLDHESWWRESAERTPIGRRLGLGHGTESGKENR